MNPLAIIKKVTDAIYYDSRIQGPFELKNTFRVKNSGLINSSNTSENFLTDPVRYTNNVIAKLNQLPGLMRNGKFSNIFCKGPGGSGKSQDNLEDTGLIDATFVSPSRKLTQAQKEKYPDTINYNVFCNISSNQINPETWINIKKYSANIIIDEVSMLTQGALDTMYKRFSDTCKLTFMGDPKFQLPPVLLEKKKEELLTPYGDGSYPFDPKSYDCITIEYTNNYRQKDSTIKNILSEMRNKIKEEDSNINNFIELNGYKRELLGTENTEMREQLIKNIENCNIRYLANVVLHLSMMD